MKLDRLCGIGKRVYDYTYIKVYLKNYFYGIRVKRYLTQLHAYHNGKLKDFSSCRDMFLLNYVKYSYSNSGYYRDMFDSLGMVHS